MNRSRRTAARLTAAVVVGALAVVGCGTSNGGAIAPVVTADGAQRVEVAFAGGAVTGGVTRYAVSLGSTVELVVASDVADQVHVHGYDRLGHIAARASTTMRFVADLPGVFDVELEQRGTLLTQLEVS